MITRADLSPGQQLAQTAHAAFEFSVKYPDIVKAWNDASNNLVCLATPDLPALRQLVLSGVDDFDYIAVREPDLGDELTAIAIVPHPKVSKLLAGLPLALREKRELVTV